MLSENEPKPARILTGPVMVLVVIIIVLILVTICALSFVYLNRQKGSLALQQRHNIAIAKSTESFLNAVPTDHYSVVLPLILTGPDRVSGQVWIVTKIKYLKYEVDGQRYDLATFRRVDSQETAKGYCLNQGWDTPQIGTEYLLTAGSTFVPLKEPKADPLQRFSRIP